MDDERQLTEVELDQEPLDRAVVHVVRVRGPVDRLVRTTEPDEVGHDDAADGREAGNHASIEEPPRGLPVEEQDRVAGTLLGVVHPQAVLLDVARLVGPAGEVVEALVRRAVRTHAATLR